MKQKFLAWGAILLPCALPLYLIRFRLFGLPTTLLECYLAIFILFFLVVRGWKGCAEGWMRLGSWRWPVIAWFLISLFEVFVSPSWVTGLGLWRAYVLEPLLVLVVVADILKTEIDRHRLQQSIFFVAMFVSAWGILQFLTGWGIPSPWNIAILAGRRATGPFPFPNALSLFLAPIGAWAFARWWKQKDDRWALAAWIFSLLGIAVAKSQGGAFAFGVVALIVLLQDRLGRRMIAWAFGVALAVLLLVAPLRELILRNATFHGWSGQVRLFIWRETWQMLKDHPIFGAGFGGYPVVFKPYHVATAIEIFQYPHNILFNFWSETGLLGVIVFGWILVKWGKAAVTSRRLVNLAPLIAILVQGLVDVPYFKNDLAILFWLFIFLTTVT